MIAVDRKSSTLLVLLNLFVLLSILPADVQMVVIKEEAPDEWSPDVEQQDPELLYMKEEEERWTSLEGEQLSVKAEADSTRFSFTVAPLKSEEDEEKPGLSQIHHCLKEDRGFPTSSSADQMKAETSGEDCRGAETSRNLDLKTHEDYSSPSETDCSEDDEDNKDLKKTDFLKPLSDSEPETEDCKNDWKEIGVPQSGLLRVTKSDKQTNNQSFLENGTSLSNCLVNKSVMRNNLDAVIQKSFHCNDCGKRYNHRTSLNRHRKVHTGKRSNDCDLCGQKFTPKSSLVSKTRIYTEQKSFGCEVCGQRFNQKTHLETHMRVHTGQKPFSCDVCGQRFTQKTNLNKHMSVHTGDKPFACDVCGQRFSQKINLNKHMSVHTGEKLFACNICGQRFSQKVTLNLHRRIHTGEKPFSCDVCKQRFSQRTHLVTHNRIHTGEKPFACDICGQRFNQKSPLKSHKTIHTGDKPFACDVCGQRFCQKTNLNRHMRLHTEENPKD